MKKILAQQHIVNPRPATLFPLLKLNLGRRCHERPRNGVPHAQIGRP